MGDPGPATLCCVTTSPVHKTRRFIRRAPIMSAAAQQHISLSGPTPPTHNHLPRSEPARAAAVPLRIIEIFERGETPRHRPSPTPARIRIDTS